MVEEARPGWWKEHGWTVTILFVAFGITLLIRSLWAYPIFEQNGWLYIYAGGSDSYYHSRVMSYIIQNHTNLVFDPGLRYPLGDDNPREPLFDWMNAVLGILFAGFFAPSMGQPSAVVAGSFFLDWQAPFWAALTVFPVYLIGKEVSSRRMGLVAAMFYPFVVASIESTSLGYANYLSYYSFVMLITVYAYLRMSKASGTRKWVKSYRHPRDIATGLRSYFRFERNGVKWAVFTGVCLGTLALSWQGYPFFIAAIAVFIVVQMIVERIRKVDSFGLYVNTWIVGLVGFPMAMPYYYFQGVSDFQGWFDTPLLVFFGALLILLPFLFLRDTPWVISVPALLITGAIAIGGLFIVDPTTFTTIVTGQGYFVKTLVYSTVAEAQAPSFDSLIIGYGVLTFFIAFVGLALIAIRIGRSRFRRDLLMFFVFAFISVYLPITAAKFFLLGSAAFVLLAGEVLVHILDVAGYAQLRKNVASLADRRSQLQSFRKSFKARHILVMALVVAIIVPNIWIAIDAGIPYNNKTPYDTQVFYTLPPPLRTAAANASSFYLGAAGTSLDTPGQYDEAGYNWLATQDTNLPLAQKPALISWWDYGFQSLDEGLHPVVADNFQNGIDPGGQFLLSQNESDAIAVLTVELLATEQTRSGDPYLPATLNTILTADGLNVTTLHGLMVNTSKDVPLVINDAGRYLAVSSGNLDPVNAMYYATTYYVASTLPLSGVAKLYDDVQSYTGWTIRYDLVDSRLIPFSGSDTGIFYAPADLTDRVIGAGGTPTAFFNVTVTGSDGNTYPAGEVPADVSAVNYNINYFAPFYDSMIYRTYFGYNGTEVGQGAGIPGLSGTISSDNPEPGWMLEHFQVVYRTAYYCASSHPSANSNCYNAVNLPTAVGDAKAYNGTADTSASSYFSGGEAILEYYPGQPFSGTVRLPDGTPVAGVRLTVYDSWGIPHMTTVSAGDGSFSLILPPGNDTVNLTSGTLNGLTQAGATAIRSIPIQVSSVYGLSLTPAPLVETLTLKPATVEGTAYWNVANNTTYNPAVDSVATGATVNLWSTGGVAYHLKTDASGSFELTDVAPGVYNASVVAGGSNYTQSVVYATEGAVENESFALTPGSVSGVVYTASTSAPADGAIVTVYSGTGAVASQLTTPSGNYTVKNLGPGNYTVVATNPGTGLASLRATFVVTGPGATSVVNLTLVQTQTVILTVRANGAPVSGFLVRLTPFVAPSAPTNVTNQTTPNPLPGKGSSTGNTSTNVTVSIPSGIANSTVYVTPANGTIVTRIPVDNYTVYGASLLGGSLYAGLTSLHLTAGTLVPATATLTLSLAYQVHGTAGAPSVAPTAISVTAFGPGGISVSAPVNSTGSWLLLLPAGTYGLEATTPISTNAASYAALQSRTVPTSGPVGLALVAAEKVSLSVGVPQASGTTYPADGAIVTVTAVPSGATTSALVDATGSVTLLVPSVLPPGATYCLNVSAADYTPYTQCGLTTGRIAELTAIPLTPTPVETTVTVLGYPAGSTIHLNLTANGAPAVSTNFTGGGSTFSAELSPGQYLVTAWSTNTTALYRPLAPFNLTIPFGATEQNVTIILLHQVNVTGELHLPTSATPSEVSVSLESTGAFLNLSGTSFTTGFLAAEGTYTLTAAATIGNVTYANVSQVNVTSSGTISPAIDLTSPGGTLRANLTTSSGALLTGFVPVNLTSSTGVRWTVLAIDGTFTALLPKGMTVYPTLNVTEPSTASNGVTEYTTFTAAPGSSCVVTANLSSCTVKLVGVANLATVHGFATYPGYPGALSGSILFIGPDPSLNQTVVPFTGSAFTATLVPGLYEVYAVSGSGSAMLAAVTTIAASFDAPFALNLTLESAWVDTLTLTSSASGLAPNAELTWTGPNGENLTLANEPVRTALPFDLPPGVWTALANSSASPYGVTTTVNGTARIDLTGGNAATTLTLTPVYNRQIAITLRGPSAATVTSGTAVSFSFSLRNTGNAPVTFHLTGSPAPWTFNFTPENYTLGVGPQNSTANGEVVVHVPSGADTNHAPIALEAILADGTAVGVASPAPTVTVLPEYGLTIGSNPNLGTVGSNSTTVPFYLLDSGNTPETVEVGVANTTALESIGWTVEVEHGAAPVTAPISLAPQENSSYDVLLTSSTNSPLRPNEVVVFATVINSTGSVTTTGIYPVPPLAVDVSNGTLTVTGPSIGSPAAYPDWFFPTLAFVPAIAVVVAAFSWRWWRTRRWVRR
jgi:dolichyl-phosphooligosaccharide-protein glycotransferase